MRVNELKTVEVIYCDWCEKEITDLGYFVFKGQLDFHDDCYEQFFDNDKKLLKDE